MDTSNAPAGGEFPPGQPEDAASARPLRGDSVDRKIDRLLDAVAQRERQIERLLTELSRFPTAAENLGESVQVQVDLANNLDELLSGLADRNEELAGMIRSVSETASEQSEILQKVQETLLSHDRTESGIADALQRLAQALEQAPRDYASQLEMMEQIRQHLGRAGLALEKAGGDLSAIADRGRQETAAAVQRLAEALERMPRGTGDLAGLLQRIHQTNAEFAAALSSGMERLRQSLDHADAAAVYNANALPKGLLQTLHEASQANTRHAENAARMLESVAVNGRTALQLARRQNKLLGWLLGCILLILAGLAVFFILRPRGILYSPFYLRGESPATQPASRPGR